MDLTVLGLEATVAAIITILIYIALLVVFIIIAFKIMRYFQRAEERDIEKIELEKQKIELIKQSKKSKKE